VPGRCGQVTECVVTAAQGSVVSFPSRRERATTSHKVSEGNVSLCCVHPFHLHIKLIAAKRPNSPTIFTSVNLTDSLGLVHLSAQSCLIVPHKGAWLDGLHEMMVRCPLHQPWHVSFRRSSCVSSQRGGAKHLSQRHWGCGNVRRALLNAFRLGS